MTDVDDSVDNALLITELRLDIATEAAALAAVRERLAVSLTTGHAAVVSARRPVPVSASASVRRKFVAASRSGLLAALAVGTALGAAGHALVSAGLERRAERDSAFEQSSVVAKKRNVLAPNHQVLPAALPEVPVVVTSASSGIVTAAPTRPSPPPSTELAPVQPGSPATSTSSLESELRQLDQARNAIAHGDPAQALGTLATHAQLHPSSILQQERDALTVKALVAAKRYTEARAAGDRFALRYPHGLLLDSVQHALASIP